MKRLHLGLLLAAAPVLAAACHRNAVTIDQLKNATAQKTGCAADAVDIRDSQLKKAPYTWTAACEGQTFTCTSANQGQCISSGPPATRAQPEGVPPPAM